ASVVATMKKYDYGPPGRLYQCWLVDDAGPNRLHSECFLPDDPKNAVLVWGDSHAALFYSGLQKAFPTLPVWEAATSNCLVSGGTAVCNDMNADVFKLVQGRRPKTVIIYQAWELYSDDWSATSPIGKALGATLTRLRKLDIPNLIVLGP